MSSCAILAVANAGFKSGVGCSILTEGVPALARFSGLSGVPTLGVGFADLSVFAAFCAAS